MQLLKSPSMTFSTVANLMKVSMTTIVRIFDNHDGINAIPMPECICIDETYAVKYKQKFVWIVSMLLNLSIMLLIL